MIKYCKILDERTGLVQVGVGCSDEYYIEIGMVERDVTQSDVDYQWYLSGRCPKKSEEEKAKEEEYKLESLHMTPLDFINALETIGVTYEQIEALCNANKEVDKQLKYCNHVYRGNKLLDQLCGQFCVAPEQLDALFKTYGE